MAMPKLYRVILPVKDIEAAAKFYQQLFAAKGKRVSSGRHYFNCGTILACYDPKADGDRTRFRPNPDHIYFSVKNLEQMFEKAKKMGFRKIDKKIKKQPWGERSFYATDPFGNKLCFVDSKTVFRG